MVRKARPTSVEGLADRLIERSELYMQAQLQRRREMWMRMRALHRWRTQWEEFSLDVLISDVDKGRATRASISL